MPLEAFSLDDDFADKVRKSLGLSHAHICDYLLLPKEISNQLYLIELTDMGKELLSYIESIKNNGKPESKSSSKKKLKKIESRIAQIKYKSIKDVSYKIQGTLTLFLYMVKNHSSISKLLDTRKEHFLL